MKLKKGDVTPNFKIVDVLGASIATDQLKGKKIYISFLRNTKCPLCSLHVFKISKQANSLKAMGLEIIVFYESPAESFKRSDFFKNHVLTENIFSVVSDPQRKVYNLFGPEISPEKATLEILKTAGRFAAIEEATKLGIQGNGIEPGTHPDAIPADFLIDENLIIQHAHYGKDAGDNISLTLVHDFAATTTN